MTPNMLRAFRARHRLSQVALARLLDVHPASVSLWEAGKRRPPDRVALVLYSIDALIPEP